MIIKNRLPGPCVFGFFRRFYTCKFNLWVCLLGLAFSGFSQESEPPPNFIFILVDDQGWTSTSVRMEQDVPGSKSDFYETPHLERLARMGMRFSRGYSSAAICSPSRRSIQFGQTPIRLGDESFASRYHPDSADHLTIPCMLKSIDPTYRAAHYGKWDLRADIYPEDLGYDESDGDTGNKDGNMNSNSITKWTEYFLNDDPKKIESLTGRAINFMKRQVSAGHPFYLQVSHYATHVDIQAKEETLERYWKRDPGAIHGNPGFAAMTADLDEGIGRIIEAVYALGIEGHTYIIYMADNGGVELIPQTNQKMIPPGEYGRKRRNYPLRGGKWTLYEGGVRVPFIVAGPGVSSGTASNIPVVGWDLLPTIADLAGYREVLPAELDGRSFRVVLEGMESDDLQHRPLFYHRYNDHYPHSAVVLDGFKLVRHWRSGDLELFDLASDPGETNDLAGERIEMTEEMNDLLVNYLHKVNVEILERY